MGDITAANAVFTLTVAGVFTAPQQLQGFDVDNAFDIDAVDTAETKIGVDGIGSGGFIYNFVPMTIHLQADSTSVQLFETWLGAQKVGQTTYQASGSILLPAISRKYTLSGGFLKTPMQLSSAHKVLQPRTFRLEWTDVSPANA